MVALFAIDLLVSGRRPHAIEFREALGWSVFYIAVVIAFGVAFGAVAGWDYGAEYFAGYVVEKSLSVDNLFVFVVIMTTLAVPREHQQRRTSSSRRTRSRCSDCAPSSSSCPGCSTVWCTCRPAWR